MKNYLIMKCEELGDQFECDADRTPMFITDSIENLHLNYDYEIYECTNTQCKKIKNYDDYDDEGTALYYWKSDEDESVAPTIIYKYPNKTRKNKIPSEVKAYIKKGYDIDNSLSNCGTIAFFIDDCYYVYGEYYGHHYPTGY